MVKDSSLLDNDWISYADKALSPNVSKESIVSQCEPEQDEIDKRILFEMTGIRLDANDFRNESSEEENIIMLETDPVDVDDDDELAY